MSQVEIPDDEPALLIYVQHVLSVWSQRKYAQIMRQVSKEFRADTAGTAEALLPELDQSIIQEMAVRARDRQQSVIAMTEPEWLLGDSWADGRSCYGITIPAIDALTVERDAFICE